MVTDIEIITAMLGGFIYGFIATILIMLLWENIR